MKENRQNLDLRLAHFCGPALAGLKPANTIWIKKGELTTFLQKVEAVKADGFSVEDVCQEPLYCDKDRIFFLLYSRALLESYLHQDSYREFLAERKYLFFTENELLTELKKRFHGYRQQKREFPHELSCFLGYPIEDIRGYIDNKGENYLFCGYWKVYHNLDGAKSLFAKFDAERERRVKQVYKQIS